jgi:succinate dehydrogenase / fumarate reductase iron-sulfur subunit
MGIRFKIWRQEGPDKPGGFEEFEVQDHPGANVISCLMEIRKNPVTADGKATTPVIWESSCLEEVCGACTMLINGRARQSCSALIRDLAQPIVLEPMRKFPLVRDLQVNRSRMFEELLKVRAWIDLDGTHDLGPGPKSAPEAALTRYDLSRCMTCGCCLEACPQYGPQSPFIGPAAINQVRLFNTHPSGKMGADQRLEVVMGEGGVMDCGNAQNCVKACPKEIPLTESLAEIMRDANKKALRDLLFR